MYAFRGKPVDTSFVKVALPIPDVAPTKTETWGIVTGVTWLFDALTSVRETILVGFEISFGRQLRYRPQVVVRHEQVRFLLMAFMSVAGDAAVVTYWRRTEQDGSWKCSCSEG